MFTYWAVLAQFYANTAMQSEDNCVEAENFFKLDMRHRKARDDDVLKFTWKRTVIMRFSLYIEMIRITIKRKQNSIPFRRGRRIKHIPLQMRLSVDTLWRLRVTCSSSVNRKTKCKDIANEMPWSEHNDSKKEMNTSSRVNWMRQKEKK